MVNTIRNRKTHSNYSQIVVGAQHGFPKLMISKSCLAINVGTLRRDDTSEGALAMLIIFTSKMYLLYSA